MIQVMKLPIKKKCSLLILLQKLPNLIIAMPAQVIFRLRGDDLLSPGYIGIKVMVVGIIGNGNLPVFIFFGIIVVSLTCFSKRVS
jgi:hypothetical protein